MNFTIINFIIVKSTVVKALFHCSLPQLTCCMFCGVNLHVKFFDIASSVLEFETGSAWNISELA